MAKNTKSTPAANPSKVPFETKDLEGFEEDLTQYEEEQTSAFPPYWTPSEDGGFLARVVDLDARDPKFLRYVLQTAAPLVCAAGPADDSTAVPIENGDFFTTSVYRGLPLHEYMGLSDPILVKVTGTRPVKGRANDMWIFSIRTSKRDHKALEERRAEKASQFPEMSAKVKGVFEKAHTATKEAAEAAARELQQS